MKLAEFGIAEANHSGLRTSKAGFSESGSGAFYETASMPVGSIAAPTVIGPTLLSRQARNMFTTSGLSLALTHGLEGQRDISRVAENEAVKAKEEGYESRSGSDNMEGASGDEQDPEQARPNKKRYHRHAPAVIQELEAFFKECPHPDEKQRQELSRRLNLATRQVKFWFQNRRTQMKAQQERHENNLLRQENERLRAENYTLREAVRNATCPTCGGPTAIEMSLEEQQIRFENARMRDELERLYALNGRLYGGKSASAGAALLSYATATPTDHVPLAVASNIGIFQNGASRDLVFGSVVPERLNFLTPLEKNMITELAVVAMEEFMKMVYASEPLWVPTPETGKDTLDFNEYLNQFPRGIGPKPDGYRSEATRETGVVMVEALSIVESFLDMNRWMELFPCIITKGDVGEVISMGTPVSRNGALQLMFAELQVPSPLVPTRQLYFLRFCKMFGDSTWAVVDVSVDNLRGDSPSAANKYRRRPSGCLIQQLPTGFSKVSWVEHSEFDDSSIHHLYRPLVMSGMAFGAHRWLSTLRRQCERQAILMANSLSSRAGGLPSEEVSRRGLLKLAQRMTAQLCNSVSASSIWTTLSGSNGEDEVRVMTRESSSDNPCEPSGMVLSAATSIWLPVSPQGVFDFLTNPSARKEWDVLSLNGPMDELVSFSKGQDPGNHVSLLRPVKGGGNMLIFQECCSDPSGSTFVYAPVDVAHMDAVMSGGDASISSVPILPSGFVIMPDGPECRPRGLLDETGRPSRVGGSLVTVAFQILVNSMPRSKLTLESINTVNTLVCNTVRNVKKTLLCDEINNINP